jgi:phenylpropionate dioxygenase-like ring-hydroxylating dioxygenase large terminal subunit
MAVTSLPPTVALVDDLLAGIREAASAPLGRAVTLPPQVYGSEEIYRLEVERVFRPGWFALARADQVSTPGDYMSVDLVGEPLVVTRDRDGDIHVLSRLCAHRLMEVTTGAGNAPALQCPYHLWTYSLSGQLVGAPHMTESADFDKTTCPLTTIRHEEWGGFVFVNLSGDAPALAPQLAALEERLAPYDLSDQTTYETIDWGECEWDWKIMVENYMECYHHIGSHRKTLQDKWPGELSWTEASPDSYALMHVPPRPGVEFKRLDGTAYQPDDGLLVNIFPATIFGVGRFGLTVLRVFPLGPGRIRLITDTCLPSELAHSEAWAEERAASMAQFRAIHLEDIGICSGVQRAAGSAMARPGRLAQLEEPLWRLYRYLGDRLGVTVTSA